MGLPKMAKGKGKGKSKNANLTEEERHQKELEKRAAEEAERIAQQQMILNYLKDKLAKEEKYSRLNNKKLVKESKTKLNNVVSDYEQLDGFWRRFNKAQLDKLALEAEKRSLEKENQALRSVLKQYLDGVSVNNETLKEPNPLFVTNQNFQLNRIPVGEHRVQRPTQTVVEAAHIVNYTLP